MAVVTKRWLSIKSLAAEHADISERTLRAFLGHPTNPLPARLVQGKWLVDVEEFDVWIRRFPKTGEHVDRLVDGILGDIQDG
jgi:hypothetical protein